MVLTLIFLKQTMSLGNTSYSCFGAYNAVSLVKSFVLLH